MDAGEAIAVLRERAERYGPHRYPVQHATAQFHLGVTLTELGRLDEAEAALATALELFDAETLPAEHATAANALGVARRARGDLDGARAAFRGARAGFERAGRTAERAAAVYNLGLVDAQAGRSEEAAAWFTDARQTFRELGERAQEAAAARELGAALLAEGDLEQAAAALVDALDGADRAGDSAGAGAAANLLGLVRLGDDRPRDAVAAFRRAAAAHPRRLRPEGYAVAKANLALAWRRAGDAAQAMLAAGQALAVPVAPPAAREVALEASGGEEPAPGAFAAVLAGAAEDEWRGIVRDELNRWLDLDQDLRAAEAGAWVRAVVDERSRRVELVAAWFGVVLELPPAEMEALLSAVLRAVAALGADDQDGFRRAAARSMVTFAGPQFLRLQHEVERIAELAGAGGSWR